MLLSREGQTVEIDKEVGLQSDYIQKVVDEFENIDVIPIVPFVKMSILEKVVEYLTYISQNEPPQIPEMDSVNTGDLETYVDEWYVNFFDVSQNAVIRLLQAGGIMGIASLHKMAQIKMATMCKSGQFSIEEWPKTNELSDDENDD